MLQIPEKLRVPNSNSRIAVYKFFIKLYVQMGGFSRFFQADE
jgi:hypothetical protein